MESNEAGTNVPKSPAEKPLISRLLPWVVLLLAALALLYFLGRGCAGAKSRTPEVSDNAAMDSTLEKDGTHTATPLETPAQEVKNVTKTIPVPGGLKVNVEEGSALEKLTEAFVNGTTNVNTAYILDHGNFQGRSAVLTPQSEKELEQLATLLKAYPKSTIRIEAHTDNTGSADINRQLSTQQSLTVLTFLQDRGTAVTRLQAIGRGQTKPLTSNDTPEGKEENKRIEIYIVSL